MMNLSGDLPADLALQMLAQECQPQPAVLSKARLS